MGNVKPERYAGKFTAGITPLVRLALGRGPPRLLFYPSCMLNFKLQFVILLPILLFLGFPAGGEVQANERHVVDVDSGVAFPVEQNPSPCLELQVTSAGVVCKSKYGFVKRLDFPKVDLKSALAGDVYLPKAKTIFSADEKTVDGKSYRNITLVLRWEPNTPEFLQIYLKEYLAYWGNRVPYRLFWSTRYEVCSTEKCTNWITVNEKGEFLPSDVHDLQDDLAADVNFNGVPAAFWNTNVSP
jgi:hypothetical protein